MGKVGQVVVLVGIGIAAYLVLLVVMPVIVDIASSANSTMAASSNMSNYPGTSEALIASPWALLFVPAVIIMIGVIVILRRR